MASISVSGFQLKKERLKKLERSKKTKRVEISKQDVFNISSHHIGEIERSRKHKRLHAPDLK